MIYVINHLLLKAKQHLGSGNLGFVTKKYFRDVQQETSHLWLFFPPLISKMSISITGLDVLTVLKDPEMKHSMGREGIIAVVTKLV